MQNTVRIFIYLIFILFLGNVLFEVYKEAGGYTASALGIIFCLLVFVDAVLRKIYKTLDGIKELLK